MITIKIDPKSFKKSKFNPIFKNRQVGFVTILDHCALPALQKLLNRILKWFRSSLWAWNLIILIIDEKVSISSYDSAKMTKDSCLLLFIHLFNNWRFSLSVHNSVKYSFVNIRLKFSVYIHNDLRKVLNYFAAKSEQKI